MIAVCGAPVQCRARNNAAIKSVLFLEVILRGTRSERNYSRSRSGNHRGEYWLLDLLFYALRSRRSTGNDQTILHRSSYVKYIFYYKFRCRNKLLNIRIGYLTYEHCYKDIRIQYKKRLASLNLERDNKLFRHSRSKFAPWWGTSSVSVVHDVTLKTQTDKTPIIL